MTSTVAMIELSQSFVKKESAAEKEMLGFAQDLQDYIFAAEMGWFNLPEIPKAARDRIKKRHPAGIPVDSILDEYIKEKLQPVYQLADKEGFAIKDQQDLVDKIQKLQNNTALTPTVGATAAIGTASRPLGLLRIRQGGKQMTPETYILGIYWALLDTMFAVSETAEADFFLMGRPGSQGNLDIRTFAEEISRLFRCVKHMGGMSPNEHVVVFFKGLNQERTRAEGERVYSDTSHLMPLEDLVDRLEEFERTKTVVQTVESKMARFQLQGKAGFKPKQEGPGGSSSGAAAGRSRATMLRVSRGSQLKQMERDNPAEYMAISNAIDLAESYPQHPAAICLDCGGKGKLHINEKCQVKMMSTAMMANAAASISSSSNQGFSAFASEMTPQQGMFRAPPKPEVSGGRGARSFGYDRGSRQHNRGFSQVTSGNECRVCGFSQGHDGGICYYDNPAAAPMHWSGPSSRTAPGLVKHYLERCAAQRVAARVLNCQGTLEYLRSNGGFSKAVWDLLTPANPNNFSSQQQNKPQQHHAAAAVQDWDMQRDSVVLPADPWAVQQATGNMSASSSGAASSSSTYKHPNAGQQAMAAMAQAAEGSSDTQLRPARKGVSFAMMALVNEQGSMDLGEEYDDNDCTAAAVTRATAGKSDTKKEAKPKSFLPAKPQLPSDPNSCRLQSSLHTSGAGQNSSNETSGAAEEVILRPDQHRLDQVWITFERLLKEQFSNVKELEACLLVFRELIPSDAVELRKQQQSGRAAKIAAALELLVNGKSVDITEDLSKISERVSATAVVETAQSGGVPVDQQFNDYEQQDKLSSSMACSSIKMKMPLELTFQPPDMSYVWRQSKRQGLDRLCCGSRAEGITLITPDDREILLDGVFVDSGANLLLVTEAFCKEIGLFFQKCDQVPGVRGWGGTSGKHLLGFTGSFKLVLAQGTPYATTIHVNRAFVVPGNAGGMYKMCLDKQTVYPFYGHVNPAWQHFVWNPKAADGNTKLVAGIPITSAVDMTGCGLAAVDVDDQHLFACIAAAQLEAQELNEQLEAMPELVAVPELTQTVSYSADHINYLGQTIAQQAVPEEAAQPRLVAFVDDYLIMQTTTTVSGSSTIEIIKGLLTVCDEQKAELEQLRSKQRADRSQQLRNLAQSAAADEGAADWENHRPHVGQPPPPPAPQGYSWHVYPPSGRGGGRGPYWPPSPGWIAANPRQQVAGQYHELATHMWHGPPRGLATPVPRRPDFNRAAHGEEDDEEPRPAKKRKPAPAPAKKKPT